MRDGGAGDPAADEAGVDREDLDDAEVVVMEDEEDEARELLVRLPRTMLDDAGSSAKRTDESLEMTHDNLPSTVFLSVCLQVIGCPQRT